MRWLWFVLFVLSAHASERMHIVRPAEFRGMADASAAVALSSNLFVVASDENNILRTYDRDHPGPPVSNLDVNNFLEIRGKSIEADLEAAARIGDRIFWIGSHGRNRNAKERPNRCRLFATDIHPGPDGISTIEPVGVPYKNLLTDLLADPRLSRFDLDRADTRAPKDAEGLNIEGLAATPEGRLLIGFRNPIPEGKALIIPLLNPNEILEGHRASLGDPIQLDLDGLGVRDMAQYQRVYLIIAGPFHSGGKSKLFRWAGDHSAPSPIKVDHLNRYNPEAIIIYPDKGLGEFQVLSDDGERPVDGIPGKMIKDPLRQKFRSFWISSGDQ